MICLRPARGVYFSILSVLAYMQHLVDFLHKVDKVNIAINAFLCNGLLNSFFHSRSSNFMVELFILYTR